MTLSDQPQLEASDWTLRIPFALSAGRQLLVPSDGLGGRVGGLIYKITRRDRGGYVFTIRGFKAEENARQFFERACAGLFLAALEHRTAVVFQPRLQAATYADDPAQAAQNLGFSGDVVDGILLAEEPAVIRSDKRMATMAAFSPTVTTGVPVERFAAAVVVGAEHGTAADELRDARVRTALDLYIAHFAEHSSEAKLLTLVMALEVFTAPVQKSPKALQVIDRWRKQIDEEIKGTSPENLEDRESLEALKGELLFRREESIRQRVRRGVKETLGAVGHPDPEGMASTALQVYDRRSRLSHEGRLDHADLQRALRDAKEIVSAVIRARLVGTGERVV